MGYVVLETDSVLEGHGPTFTCGRGTEVGRYLNFHLTNPILLTMHNLHIFCFENSKDMHCLTLTFLGVYLVDERRGNPNTTIRGPSSLHQ